MSMATSIPNVRGLPLIGNHFAMMEGQLVLAALARSVTFELLEPQRIAPEPLVTLRPRYGIKMIVRRH